MTEPSNNGFKKTDIKPDDFCVVTNADYSQCLSLLSDKNFQFQKDPLSAQNRFATVSHMLKRVKEKHLQFDINDAYEILDEVSFNKGADYQMKQFKSDNYSTRTVWSIVYDYNSGFVFFKSNMKKTVKKISLRSFKFRKNDDVYQLPINTDYEMDVSDKFTVYNTNSNAELVRNAHKIFGENFTPNMVNGLIEYQNFIYHKNISLQNTK